MKKIILGRVAGLLLATLSVSCSTEEAVAVSAKGANSENVAAFRAAFSDYGRTRKGEFFSKGSPEANATMAKASTEFLLSIGVDRGAIERKGKMGEEALIGLAVVEYAKVTSANPKP